MTYRQFHLNSIVYVVLGNSEVVCCTVTAIADEVYSLEDANYDTFIARANEVFATRKEAREYRDSKQALAAAADTAKTEGDEYAFTCTCGAYFVEGTGELCGDCVDKLRNQLAAVTAERDELRARVDSALAIERYDNEFGIFSAKDALDASRGVGFNDARAQFRAKLQPPHTDSTATENE